MRVGVGHYTHYGDCARAIDSFYRGWDETAGPGHLAADLWRRIFNKIDDIGGCDQIRVVNVKDRARVFRDERQFEDAN